ncbi:Pentatricopeptide repeat-containing protein, mitochondrial [Galdieria sulphuraria]|nr:Pentatricopeptide repeat-containing protein, mitochondrial [Galdieria sulphuraria]
MYVSAARSLRAARTVLLHRTEKRSRTETRFGANARLNNSSVVGTISSLSSSSGNGLSSPWKSCIDATQFAPGSCIISNSHTSWPSSSVYVSNSNTTKDSEELGPLTETTGKWRVALALADSENSGRGRKFCSEGSLFLCRRFFSIDTRLNAQPNTGTVANSLPEEFVDGVHSTEFSTDMTKNIFDSKENTLRFSSPLSGDSLWGSGEFRVAISNRENNWLPESFLSESHIDYSLQELQDVTDGDEIVSRCVDSIVNETTTGTTEQDSHHLLNMDNSRLEMSVDFDENANSANRFRTKHSAEYLNQQREIRNTIKQELLQGIEQANAKEELDSMFKIWEESFNVISDVVEEQKNSIETTENHSNSAQLFQSSVLKLDKHVSPRSWLYDIVLLECFNREKMDLVEHILYCMFCAGVTIRPRWFSQLINLYSKRGQLGSAFGVLDSMSLWGVFPDSYVYSSLLQACVRSNRFDLALKVYEHLQQEGYVMDAHMYNTLVNGAGSLGDLETAERLVRQAQEYNVGLDTALCNTFLVSCAKHHDISRAEHLFLEMSNGNMGSLALPNGKTYNILINLYCKMNPPQVERALEMVERQRMYGFSPDESTFCPIIDAYFRVNDPFKAIELFKKLRTEGSPKLSRVTYDTVINGLGRSGYLDDAFEVFRIRASETSLESLDDTTYNNLLNAFVENNRLDEAERFFQESLASGFQPSTATYNIRLKALLSQGHLMQGFKLVEEMVSRGIQPNLITFNTLLDIALRGQHYVYIDSIVNAIRKSNVRPDIYTFNLRLQAAYRLGVFMKAEEIYSEMIASNIRPDVYTYVYLMACAGRRNDTVQGVKYLKEAVKKGRQPKGPIAYRPLLHAAMRNGSIEDVITIVNAMKAVSLYLDEKLQSRFISWCRNNNVDPNLYVNQPSL